MFDFWNKLPKWLKDSVSVTVLMTILLIAYDVIMPLVSHQPYSMTTIMFFPFQVLIAFAVVAYYNRHKQATKEREKAAKIAKIKQEQLEAEQKAQQHVENTKRNQQAAQKQRQTKD